VNFEDLKREEMAALKIPESRDNKKLKNNRITPGKPKP
jgi:hypothetical protein